MKELEVAQMLATWAHRNQVDKAGRPYILHPERVAVNLSSDVEKAVAWLHDVIEDTDVNAQDMMKLGISFKVAKAVTALTHLPGEPNVTYWARIKENPLALSVKLADIADNSSKERMAALDVETQERLTIKYAKAVQFLTA